MHLFNIMMLEYFYHSVVIDSTKKSKRKQILSDPEINEYEKSELFDIRFYVASFAGYGLHANCMHTLTEFRDL